MDIITKKIQLNTINTLTIEIEETFNNEYSILAYDEEGGVWIEKFAKDLQSAEKISIKLQKSILKEYE